MPDLPAVCDTCGTFFPSGIVGENSANITSVGSRAGPCPNCGGMGHIPDGTYSFTQDTIELLQGPQRTVSELERLAEILREARQRNASVEEVKRTIREETPGLNTLADLLPRNRAELYAFIALILTTIQLLLSSPGNIQNTDIDLDVVIEKTVEQQTQQPRAAQLRSQDIPKVGRNEPCPCGSGKKYKKCHGDPTREQQQPPPR